MNSIKKRVTLTVLVVGGIAAISVALAIPALLPILVPVGCVMLSGAFGMFQSVIRSTENNAANQERTENENGAECDHVEVNRHEQAQAPNNNINILFMYNQYNNNASMPENNVNPTQSTELTLV